MNIEENDLVKDYEFTIFLENFSFNMDMLFYKLKRIKNIDVKKDHFEYYLLFDSIIVQLRAIILENKTSNYTLQTYFQHIQRDDISEKINNFLDEPFNASDLELKESGYKDYRTIRKALKFISDKFICHYDKVTKSDIGQVNYIIAELNNPFGDRNLIKILENILDICKI